MSTQRIGSRQEPTITASPIVVFLAIQFVTAISRKMFRENEPYAQAVYRFLIVVTVFSTLPTNLENSFND